MLRFIFLCTYFVSLTVADPDLCLGAACPAGSVCRMVELCTTTCTAAAICVQPATTTQPLNPCAEGNPLITEFGLERTCQIDGGNCPGTLGCFLTAGLVEGRCCATGTTPPSNNKPGTCPTNTGFPVCFNFCATDSNCLGDAKCCFNGCGLACVLPQSTITTPTTIAPPTVTTSRPGTCSPAQYNQHGSCTSTCTADSQCLAGQKCCNTGCGSHCTSVLASSKPGSCPADKGFGYCHGYGNLCSIDSDCMGNLKCCSSNCGKKCESPLQHMNGKPGTCPYVSRGYSNNYNSIFCFSFCEFDYDCFGISKCCVKNDGCSKMCMVPYSK